MENNKNSNRVDPRKDYGWKVTDKELEDNFLLVCNASYMAYEFALASAHQNLFNLADEQLQRLQQQSISPFPLPEKGFTIAQAELILAAESWVERASKQLSFVEKLDAYREEAVSKADLEGFHERFAQTIAAFRGGEKSFLTYNYERKGADADGKSEKPADSTSKNSGEALSQELEHNLRLAYEAIFWTNIAAANADVYLETIYENNLNEATERLKRLKNDSKNPSEFPSRGYTLAQAKMWLDLERFAKAAYDNFHRAFDKDLLKGAGGINRKESLNKLYREFNPQDGDEPQTNIKLFLGSELFHKKNPMEIPKEGNDFWVTPEGKKFRKQAWWLRR